MSTRWKPFPYPNAAYDCSGPVLKRRWARLHQGDREPYPDINGVTRLVAHHPDLEPPIPIDEAVAELVQAWRAYHRGDFAGAVEHGLSLGPLGYNAANKATNIYATYLETNDRSKLAIFLEAAKRAEDLQVRAPSLANAWYLHAQALGRYAQGISITAALAGGIAGKYKASLDRTLEIDGRHADAHVALGAYHAEIICKLGALVGRLTYGASQDEAVRHFKTALKLNPTSAIARIEYANGLVMLHGAAKLAEARRLYEDAARCEPADAMERLDVELAKEELVD